MKNRYHAGQKLVEVRLGGVIKEQYVWNGAGGIDRLVFRNRDADGNANNGVYGMEDWLGAIQDANGDVMATVNYSGIAERYGYTPYGVMTALTVAGAVKAGGSDLAWTVGHQGLMFVANAGMYANRARWYSPTLMRFASTDPLGYGAGDANIYRYEGNNPSTRTDPSGLQPAPVDQSSWIPNTVYLVPSAVAPSGQFVRWVAPDIVAARNPLTMGFVPTDPSFVELTPAQHASGMHIPYRGGNSPYISASTNPLGSPNYA